MEYVKCKICNEYHWDNENCEPEYLVYHYDYLGEEPKSVHACSHEDAATKYAEYYNTHADYALMNDNTIEVKVEGDGEIHFYKLQAEPEIYYSADEVDSINEYNN